MSAGGCCSKVEEALDGSDLMFIRRLEGTFTEPSLVRDRHNRIWLIKAWAPQFIDNAFANEMIGSYLCRAVGLPTPECKKIWIGDDFFGDSRTWVRCGKERIRPKAGMHLAARYFPDAEQTEAIEFLPPTLRALFETRRECLGMVIFDAWANHADRRQALFFQRARGIHATFIDHSHLFGGPTWSNAARCCAPANFVQRVAEEEYESSDVCEWMSRMRQVIPAAFDRVIHQIPEAWYSGDISILRDRYVNRLMMLSLATASLMSQIKQSAYKSLQAEAYYEDHRVRILSTTGTDLWL